MKKFIFKLLKYKFIVCKMILSIIILSSIFIGFQVLLLISTISSIYFLFFCKEFGIWINSILIIHFNILNFVLLVNKKDIVNNIMAFLPFNLIILIFTISNIMANENKLNLFYLITSVATQAIVLSYNFNLVGYLYSNNTNKLDEIKSNESFKDLESRKDEHYEIIEDDDWGYFVDTEIISITSK